jgi:DNA-directed RNA polymerase specialized sigma subunit
MSNDFQTYDFQPDDYRVSARRRHRQAPAGQARNRRMLNNLPLAHRLAADGAVDESHREQRLGQAMVGLVEAANRFDDTGHVRFGAFAEPCITRALARVPGADEVAAAQAEIAAAISSQERVQELASFLQVPTAALVGGLMDATARERTSTRLRLVHGAA